MQGEEVEVKHGHVRGREKALEAHPSMELDVQTAPENDSVFLTSMITVGSDRPAQLRYIQETKWVY